MQTGKSAVRRLSPALGGHNYPQWALKWDFEKLRFAASAVVFFDKPGAAVGPRHPTESSIGDTAHGSSPILSFTACRNRCLHPR